MQPPHPVNFAHLERRADRAAASPIEAAFVHEHTRRGMLDRLAPMTIAARDIVLLGCAAPPDIPQLAQRFRGARLVCVDRSARRLQAAAGQRRRWRPRAQFCRADPWALPLADHGTDLLWSNLSLAGLDDPARVLAETSRVLSRDGLFVFASLGPDSFAALRRAWAAADDDAHVQRFPDMHDLGDLLVRAGLRDPVLDVERLTIEYAGPAALFRDLTAAGARNVLATRRRSLTGRRRFARMTSALEPGAGPLRLELELVFGHCWGGGKSRAGSDVRIDAASISLRRKFS